MIFQKKVVVPINVSFRAELHNISDRMDLAARSRALQ